MNHLSRQQIKLLLLSALGGVLEFYDFIIYIFIAPYIEKLFFADSSHYIATLKTLAIFSIGYLIRPLGGIVFSHFGDRHGRKTIFLVTVILMAIPSFAISILPTTAQIGLAAPMLLLTFRIMQGLALGGEIPASITFVSEHIQLKHRGIALAFLFFGINLGLLAGSLITTILTSTMAESSILAYGWRIPFFIGGIFGIAAVFLRRHLHETSAFTAMQPKDVQRIPLFTLLREAGLQVNLGIAMVALGSVTVFFYLYWPIYLHDYFHYDTKTLMHINTIGTLFLNFVILAGGWLTDYVGARKSFLLCAVTLAIISYPLFLCFGMGIQWVIFSYMIFSIVFGFIPSAYCSILSEMFPTPIRYSGISLSYNLAYAIFGGLSPIICTVAIERFHSVYAPALYVVIIAAFAGTACIATKYLKPRHAAIQLAAAVSP